MAMLLTGYQLVGSAMQLCSCIFRHFRDCKGAPPAFTDLPLPQNEFITCP